MFCKFSGCKNQVKDFYNQTKIMLKDIINLDDFENIEKKIEMLPKKMS